MLCRAVSLNNRCRCVTRTIRFVRRAFDKRNLRLTHLMRITMALLVPMVYSASNAGCRVLELRLSRTVLDPL